VTWLKLRFRLADTTGSTSESEESSWICQSHDGAQPEAARVIILYLYNNLKGPIPERISELLCEVWG
jgi:hypothetical protein